MRRETLLDQAKALVAIDRAKDYGDLGDNFARIAGLWSAYRGDRDDEFTGADVALMMALVKVARLAANPAHGDSWVDLAGYAACGSEVSDEPQRLEVGITSFTARPEARLACTCTAAEFCRPDSIDDRTYCRQQARP